MPLVAPGDDVMMTTRGKYTVTYITPAAAVTPAAYLCDFLGALDSASVDPREAAPRRVVVGFGAGARAGASTAVSETFTVLTGCTLALDHIVDASGTSLPIADSAVVVLADNDDDDE
jgi:hypothetical protein